MLIIAQRCQLWFKQKEWWSDGIRLVDLLTILRPCMFWFWPETTSPHIKPTASGSCHSFSECFHGSQDNYSIAAYAVMFPTSKPSFSLVRQVPWAQLLTGQSGPLGSASHWSIRSPGYCNGRTMENSFCINIKLNMHRNQFSISIILVFSLFQLYFITNSIFYLLFDNNKLRKRRFNINVSSRKDSEFEFLITNFFCW